MSYPVPEKAAPDKRLQRELQSQYTTDAKLQTRIETHKRYSTNPQLWSDWLLSLLNVQGDERALDIGTGSGEILMPLARKLTPHGGHVAALDMSAGVIENARQAAFTERLNVTYIIGQAQHLPFPDASFDLVLATHMLYYVPDITAAVAEIRRVLRNGGRFLATTNSSTNMSELHELEQYALQSLGIRYDAAVPRGGSGRFTMENGLDYIAPVFGNEHVQTFIRTDSLQFHDAEPLVAYVRSNENARVPAEMREDFFRIIADRVTDIINEVGVCVIGKRAGAFLATKV